MKLPTHDQLTVSTAAQDRMLWTSPFRTKQEVVVEIEVRNLSMLKGPGRFIEFTKIPFHCFNRPSGPIIEFISFSGSVLKVRRRIVERSGCVTDVDLEFFILSVFCKVKF